MALSPTIDIPNNPFSIDSKPKIESRIVQKPKNDGHNYVISSFPISFRNKLISQIKKEDYSINVLRNAIHLIEKLPESLISKLNEESFYKSSYNTLIIDFESDNNSLTIDIGSKSFGYFIEKDDQLIDLKENLEIETREKSIKSYTIINQSIIANIL